MQSASGQLDTGSVTSPRPSMDASSRRSSVEAATASMRRLRESGVDDTACTGMWTSA